MLSEPELSENQQKMKEELELKKKFQHQAKIFNSEKGWKYSCGSFYTANAEDGGRMQTFYKTEISFYVNYEVDMKIFIEVDAGRVITVFDHSPKGSISINGIIKEITIGTQHSHIILYVCNVNLPPTVEKIQMVAGEPYSLFFDVKKQFMNFEIARTKQPFDREYTFISADLIRDFEDLVPPTAKYPGWQEVAEQKKRNDELHKKQIEKARELAKLSELKKLSEAFKVPELPEKLKKPSKIELDVFVDDDGNKRNKETMEYCSDDITQKYTSIDPSSLPEWPEYAQEINICTGKDEKQGTAKQKRIHPRDTEGDSSPIFTKRSVESENNLQSSSSIDNVQIGSFEKEEKLLSTTSSTPTVDILKSGINQASGPKSKKPIISKDSEVPFTSKVFRIPKKSKPAVGGQDRYEKNPKPSCPTQGAFQTSECSSTQYNVQNKNETASISRQLKARDILQKPAKSTETPVTSTPVISEPMEVDTPNFTESMGLINQKPGELSILKKSLTESQISSLILNKSNEKTEGSEQNTSVEAEQKPDPVVLKDLACEPTAESKLKETPSTYSSREPPGVIGRKGSSGFEDIMPWHIMKNRSSSLSRSESTSDHSWGQDSHLQNISYEDLFAPINIFSGFPMRFSNVWQEDWPCSITETLLEKRVPNSKQTPRVLTYKSGFSEKRTPGTAFGKLNFPVVSSSTEKIDEMVTMKEDQPDHGAATEQKQTLTGSLKRPLEAGDSGLPIESPFETISTISDQKIDVSKLSLQSHSDHQSISGNQDESTLQKRSGQESKYIRPDLQTERRFSAFSSLFKSQRHGHSSSSQRSFEKPEVSLREFSLHDPPTEPISPGPLDTGNDQEKASELEVWKRDQFRKKVTKASELVVNLFNKGKTLDDILEMFIEEGRNSTFSSHASLNEMFEDKIFKMLHATLYLVDGSYHADITGVSPEPLTADISTWTVADFYNHVTEVIKVYTSDENFQNAIQIDPLEEKLLSFFDLLKIKSVEIVQKKRRRNQKGRERQRAKKQQQKRDRLATF